MTTDSGLEILGLLAADTIVIPSSAPAPIQVAARRAKAAFGERIQICDGVADEEQLQASHDNLPTNGGRTIWVAGDYNITQKVRFTRPIKLDGYGARLLSTADIVMLETEWHWLGHDGGVFDPWSPMSIKGLYIQNSVGSGATGLHILDTYGARFQDIMIKDCDYGSHLENVGDTCENCFLENIWIWDPLKALWLEGAADPLTSFCHCNFEQIRINLLRDTAIGFEMNANSLLAHGRAHIGVHLDDHDVATYTSFKLAGRIEASDIDWFTENFVTVAHATAVYGIEVVGTPALQSPIRYANYGFAPTALVTPNDANQRAIIWNKDYTGGVHIIKRLVDQQVVDLLRIEDLDGTVRVRVHMQADNRLQLATTDTFRAPTIAAQVRVYNNANITIGDDSWTALTFNSERFDDLAQHSTTIDTSHLTCKEAGKYLIIACVAWAAHATGNRMIGIRKGGATYDLLQNNQALAAGGNIQTLAAIMDLAVDEYVELMVHQTSGGELNVSYSAGSSPEFMMQRIG